MNGFKNGTKVTDLIRSFCFENADVRGVVVHLRGAYQRVCKNKDYPAALQTNLGRLVVGSCLMTCTQKSGGGLSLQTQGNGPVSLFFAECTNDFKVRGCAEYSASDPSANFDQLIGNGTFVVNNFNEQKQVWQGIVPLEKSVHESLEKYCAQSLQIPTRIIFQETSDEIAGILLQTMPVKDTGDEALEMKRREDWERLQIFLDTLREKELCNTNTESLLDNLFPEDEIRLFHSTNVAFGCDCSLEGMRKAIFQFGRGQAESALQGDCLDIKCNLCGTKYIVTSEDLDNLF